MLLVFSLSVSCSKDDDNTSTPTSDKIPFNGSYEWVFDIPSHGSQKSINTFYPDYIQYTIEGSAYSNQYAQTLYWYYASDKKLITIGKGGNPDKTGKYFVLFFKDITNTSLSIYKRECSNLEEAKNFPLPAVNATTDHGWNVYNKK
ncbi:MAG: hypothetical protein K2X95_09970 [Flavobacteriaceae bacterium]|nr:hypothetical protein [Flavobacteriaceae bacterium]